MIAGLHDKKCRRENPSNVVNSGEFILGYRNEYGYAAEAPKLGDDGDLGRDGTYLVFRQTRQDVAAFRDFLKQNAPGDAAEQERLGAKMVGRWKNGTPLIASPFREDLDFKPTAEHANDFGFAGDPKGFACPLGAHIRRANPRDSASLGSPKDAVHRSNRHRLLRRGRPYGRRIDDDQATPETERGLHFIALCSDLERQFEFVAQTWIGNPAFEELDEVDPLVGGQCPGPTFTVQAPFGRRRVTGLTSFVQLVGGAYFFVPSRSAVRWLASGATTANPGNAAARNGGRHEAAQAGLPQKTAPWVSTAFGRNCRNAIAAARPPGWRPSTSARADRPTAPEPSEGILPVGKSVQTDTMTGLANRAGLMLELETIIERSKHDGSPFALLYMDVDNFKYVNDTRGHSVGDEPLKAVGETLHGCVREGDLAGRLGGDEFVVLIPHCDQPQAAALADRVFAKLTSTVVNKERPAGFWSAWPAFRKLPSMYPKHFSCRPNDVRGKAQRQKSGRHAFSLTAGAGL
jgi:Dyp-type peroxidase family